MANIILNKVAFEKAVANIVDVDMGIQDLLFPKQPPKATKFIKYDTVNVEGIAPEYNDFKNTPVVVQNDGFDRITVAPVNYSLAKHKEDIDLEVAEFGVTPEDANYATERERQALNGVGRLKLNVQVGIKAMIYEAMTTGKIAKAYQGKEGREDIVFNIPIGNKFENDGTTYKYWDDNDSTPLDDIKRVYDAMLIKPEMVIMGSSEYSLFYDNKQVMDATNSSTGTKRNFIVSESNSKKKFKMMGTIHYKGMTIDVYVESQTRLLSDKTTRVPYMPEKMVVFASQGGSTTEFGGIPTVSKAKGVFRIAREELIGEFIETKPPVSHDIVYQTAPLTLIKNGEMFATLKTRA